MRLHNEGKTRVREKKYFLTWGKYPHRMEGGNITTVAEAIYRKAGIQQKGSRKGTRIFHHRLAMHLAGKNISRAVISDTLGTRIRYLSKHISLHKS